MTDDERGYHVAGLRVDFNLATRHWLHRFGAEFRSLSANYDYASNVTFAAGYPYPESPAITRIRDVQTSPEGDHVAAYFTSRVQVTPRLTAELGLRWDEQTYVEDADEQFGPRLNLLYDLSDDTRLRASWGRYQQAAGIDELQVEDGVDKYPRAQRADHLIVGLEHTLSNDWQLRVEAYHKDYDDLRARYENLFDPISLVPDLRGDRVRIAPDSARADGAELLLARRSTDPWNGWLSYTWSRVEDRIDGRDVPRSWDQMHAVSTGVTWAKAPWDASIALAYHTGWPDDDRAARHAGRQLARRRDRPAQWRPLSRRSRRSTCASSRTFPLRIGELTAHAEVTNALNRDNPAASTTRSRRTGRPIACSATRRAGCRSCRRSACSGNSDQRTPCSRNHASSGFQPSFAASRVVARPVVGVEAVRRRPGRRRSRRLVRRVERRAHLLDVLDRDALVRPAVQAEHRRLERRRRRRSGTSAAASFGLADEPAVPGHARLQRSGCAPRRARRSGRPSRTR